MDESSGRAAELCLAVRSLPTVSDAALLRDEQGREVLVADGSVSGPRLRAAVSAAGLRPPERIIVVASAPAREPVATWLHTPSAQVYDFVAPAGTVEETLCAIWREVLHVTEVGAEDDLLDLGGDSLAAIEIATRVEEHFGVECDLDLVFRAGTVRGLAVELERLGAATTCP